MPQTITKFDERAKDTEKFANVVRISLDGCRHVCP
jgi:hypothetical protein